MTRRSFGYLRKLPSGRYQASYIGPDGRRHLAWTTYLVKADAEAWLRDEELLTDVGTWTAPATRTPYKLSDPLTLSEYADSIIKRRLKRARKPLRESTAENYRKLLRLTIPDELGDMRLGDITPTTIQRWYASLPDDKPTQRGNAYNLVHSILSDAEDEELIDRNPARIKGAGKPTPKRQGRALNVGQLGVYVHHAGAYAVPLLVTAWCGLRSGEVRALRRCDISPDASMIRVAQGVVRIGYQGTRRWHLDDPKTAAGVRQIAVPPHVQPVLAAWIEDHPGPDDGLVFPARDGSTFLSEGVLRSAHKRAAAAIGHPDLTLHDLRRTGATLAAQSGATVKEVMRMLGHTKPDVAMIYQVADDQRDVERAQRMSRLAGWQPEAVEA